MLKLTILVLAMVTMASAATKEFTVTAYCGCEKCCGKWSKYQKTVSGVKPQEGITCAAPRSIPFGTKLSLEGIGTRIVQDRLAAKYDSRIDIYFNDHKKALKFGKRRVRVTFSDASQKSSNQR